MPQTADQILLVEADPTVLRARADELLADGHELDIATSRAAANVKLPGVTVLILGDVGGTAPTLALLRDLRTGQIPHADTAIPVIAIGADHDHEQVRYYLAGADIALPSSASPTLINTALHALAARSARRAKPPPSVLVGDLRIDRGARTATVAGELVQFTNREFDVLLALAERPNQAVPISELYKRVWGTPDHRGRSADAQLARVRAKLRQAGSTVEIQGVRGYGPRLTPGSPADRDQPRRTIPSARPGAPPGRGRGR